MSKIAEFVTKVVLPPVIAALLPLAEKKIDEAIPRLEAVVEKVLAEKLDELVPDSIEKAVPEILEAVGTLVPQLVNHVTDSINAVLKGFGLGGGILGGLRL